MLLAKSLKQQAPTTRTSGPVDVPRTFLGFLDWMGVTPRPGQAEFARVAYDGAEPLDRDRAVRIFGPIDFAGLPVGLRRVVAAVVGGRGGKSYLLIALRLVWGLLVRDLSPLASGEEAYSTVVAPNEDLRQQVINYAFGAMRSKAELAPLLRVPKGLGPHDVPSEFGVWREDFGRVVTFQGAVATRGGYGVRGRWHTDLALDECAFFRDKTAKVNDKDIFEAGVARVLDGGQVILGSTPWAKAGLLYELYEQNYGKPTTALVAHAPTLELNDDAYIRDIVETEYKRDPENAEREYGAKFMAGGSTVFFEPDLIAEHTADFATPQPGDVLAAGGDFGFRSDSSSLATVAHRAGVILPVDLVELQPEEGKPLKPSVTVGTFAKTLRERRITAVMADQHYRESITEHLETHDLTYVSAPTVPADAYIRARMLLRDGRVKLPKNERFLQQMREVQGRPLPGGGMSIVHPRWRTGGHGDLVAAWVLAVWQVSGDAVPATPPQAGTREHEAALVEARHRAWLEEKNRPAWQRGVDRGRNATWRR